MNTNPRPRIHYKEGCPFLERNNEQTLNIRGFASISNLASLSTFDTWYDRNDTYLAKDGKRKGRTKFKYFTTEYHRVGAALDSIVHPFESLPDLHHTCNRRPLPGDVPIIAVCGVIVGYTGSTLIAWWAKTKKEMRL